MGYSGLSGIYIPREVIESAYDQEGMVLQFYRAHNTSKSNPSKYFDDINALNASETLKTCGETRLMDSQAMSVYARVTNDWDGVDNSSGTGGKVLFRVLLVCALLPGKSPGVLHIHHCRPGLRI